MTVVEFFDYRCPFCKAAEPDVEKLLADNPDIRLVLKEFPILDAEDQTHISEDAARAAIAANAAGQVRPRAPRPAGPEDPGRGPPRSAVLKAAGVDLRPPPRPMESSTATTTQIADTRALARALGIDGTPAFIIGDQMVSGAQMDLVKAALASARKAVRR